MLRQHRSRVLQGRGGQLERFLHGVQHARPAGMNGPAGHLLAAQALPGKPLVEPAPEVTLDEYASYMSETHIANLGGQYKENLSGDKSVNLVAIIPGDHVYSTGQDLKVLPLQSAVR